MNLYTFIFEYDKFRHFLVSLLIFLVIFYIRKYRIKNRGFLKILSYTIRDVFVIGLLKEFTDLLGFGDPDIRDLFADSIGIIFPIYIYYLFKESKKTENSSFFKYEKELINKLEKNIAYTFKELYLFVNIMYKQTFFKRKMFLTLKSRIKKYYLLKSLRELGEIGKTFILFTLVWILNIFVLFFKIPFLALVDTYKIVFKSISFITKKKT